MQRINQIFNQVAADHQSGSGSLLQQLTEGLLGTCSGEHTFTKAEKKIFEHILINFQHAMKDFALIRHFTTFLQERIQQSVPLTYRDLYDTVLTYNQQWHDIEQRVVRFFRQNVSMQGKTILTHSQSATIMAIFTSAEERDKPKIIQTESRPVMEGRMQALKLAEAGYNVSLITDTGYTPLLKKTDMVVLGADAIWSDVFVNKCGSWALSLLAAKHDIPVYVVADSRKFTPAPAPPDLIRSGNKPPEEILEFPPKGIQPVNHYFEAIPTRSVTAFIFENRKIPGQEMPLTALK